MKNNWNLILVFLIIIQPILVLSQANFQILDSERESKIKAIIGQMSVEEKIGQTCQITLDAFLERNEKGNVIEPIQIDQSKLDEAILTYKVGSILNVGSHTLTLQQWSMIMEAVHAFYRTKQTAPFFTELMLFTA